LKVTLLSYMQMAPDYLYDHDWQVSVESEPEWIASALMRSTRTLRPMHVILNENNEVPCPVCKGKDPRIDECWLCEGVGIVSIVKKRIYDSLKMQHFTIAGMTDWIFIIEDVSRSLTHQLVRHRTSWFLQQSSRATDPTKKKPILPESAEGDTEIAGIYFDIFTDTEQAYKTLLKKGVPREDARFVLPQATNQRITMKIDGSNLIHFFKLRTDAHAQWEIRDLANRMLKKVQRVCPTLFNERMRRYWW